MCDMWVFFTNIQTAGAQSTDGICLDSQCHTIVHIHVGQIYILVKAVDELEAA